MSVLIPFEALFALREQDMGRKMRPLEKIAYGLFIMEDYLFSYKKEKKP